MGHQNYCGAKTHTHTHKLKGFEELVLLKLIILH